MTSVKYSLFFKSPFWACSVQIPKRIPQGLSKGALRAFGGSLCDVSERRGFCNVRHCLTLPEIDSFCFLLYIVGQAKHQNLRHYPPMFMRIRYCVVLFFLISTSLSFAQVAGRHTPVRTIQSTPKSDVFIEGFYWNSTPGGIWWDSRSPCASVSVRRIQRNLVSATDQRCRGFVIDGLRYLRSIWRRRL